MSTIHNINGDLSAATAALQPADMVPVYDAAAGVSKKMSGSLLAAGAATPVNTTATTLAITQASHAGRVVTVSSAAPFVFTLPASAGTGSKYTFQMQVAATGTTSAIKVANGTDIMQGIALAVTTTSTNTEGFATSATSDTIAMNGTTLGGVVGDVYELTDVKTGFWSVRCYTAPTGAEATPFSATVS